MNIYVVVEGKTEQIVYKSWIPLINSNLKFVENITDIDKNSVYLISGLGYPNYFDIIDSAISDINNYRSFDRFVISVDSEEMTYEEKYSEIQEFLDAKQCISDIRIVIQHFCFECWALGNRKVIKANPTSPRLQKYKKFFDVRLKDPELLPGYPNEELNRSQFAKRYLRAALNQHHKNLTYSESEPKYICYYKYFEQMKLRLTGTGHIASFIKFLDAFV